LATLHAQLTARLKKGRPEPWSELLRDYLEDIGVSSYKIIQLDAAKDGKAVALLLTQLLGFPHAHGLGRLHSDRAVSFIPDFFRAVLGNLEVFSDWIGDANADLFSQRFTRKFRPLQYYDLDAVRKCTLEGSEAFLPGRPGEHVQSGSVYFFAQGRIASHPKAKMKLGRDDWLYAEVGYDFTISRGSLLKDKNNPVTVALYATFYGRGFEAAEWITPYGKTFPDEPKAQNRLRECLTKARERALNGSSGAVHEALHHFAVP
jgi:hypothetical protein